MHHTRRIFLATLFLLPIVLHSAAVLSAAERTPNFVYIFTDEQRWDAFFERGFTTSTTTAIRTQDAN